MDSIYIDGKKDLTLKMIKADNGKYYKSVEIEEHYAIIGEPGIIKYNMTPGVGEFMA